MSQEFNYMKQIVDQIRLRKFNNREIEDELIDHFCTKYEEQARTAPEAEIILSEIIFEIRNLELSNLKKERKIMTTQNLLITIALLLISSFTAINYTNSQSDEDVAVSQLAVSSTVDFKVEFEDPPFGSPIPNAEVVSGFGQRKHPITKKMKLHKGCDLKAALGTHVISVEKGTVSDCGYHEKNGYYIEIKHDEVYSTRYHHLSVIDVKKGEQIEKLQKIGEVGSTGLSTAPHLHYEIIKSGEWVDVSEYLKA